MGLLEKALKYKDEVNKRGNETLIDKIPGPADSEFENKPEQNYDDLKRDKTGQPEPDRNTVENENPEHDEFSEIPDEETHPRAAPGDEDLSVDIDGEDDIFFLEADDLQAVYPESDSDVTENETGFHNKESESGMENSAFSDYLVLYETVQEILNAASFEELTDVILFLAMGQMASSSASILLPDSSKENSWIIFESRGIKAATRDISFDSESGIIRELHNRSSIIDIDVYRKDSEFSSDYIKFISIDTRLVVPMIYENEITGILTLGEKISGEAYTDEDYSYLNSLGKTAALALRNISLKKWSFRDISNIESEIKKSDRVKSFIGDIYSARGREEISRLLQEYLSENRYTDYVVYIKPEIENRFIPYAGTRMGTVDFSRVFYPADEGSALVRSLAGDEVMREYDCENETPVAEIIGKNYLSWFLRAVIIPVCENSLLKGFFCFMESGSRNSLEIDESLIDTIKHPVTTALHNAYVSESRNYLKTFNSIVEKINREISRAESLSMPLTLIMVTVKNFKRLFNTLGADSANEFFLAMENLTAQRISDSDTFMRYDKNRMLILLPGKDKKYASALANSIKTELNSCWPDPDGSPLVTVLISQFPGDADNVYSLLDLIE